MKSSISFIFAAMFFMGTLSMVSANIWKIQIECKLAFYLIITHENELGSQKISYTNLKARDVTCSNDEIICLKDLRISMDSCEKVTVDFKVQYANQWSNDQHMVHLCRAECDMVLFVYVQFMYCTMLSNAKDIEGLVFLNQEDGHTSMAEDKIDRFREAFASLATSGLPSKRSSNINQSF
ncbi:hypothetical protein EDC96DRAFT_546495 [Choanephora cucurbitarum]|nr:hypothetical protein EDC96DRAFT_546495 [Choanephora cucurbitarum]